MSVVSRWKRRWINDSLHWKIAMFFCSNVFYAFSSLEFFFHWLFDCIQKNDKVMIGMARSWLSWYLNRCYRNLYGKLFFLLMFKNMSLCQSLSLLCFFFKVIKECLRFVTDLCRFSNVFFQGSVGMMKKLPPIFVLTMFFFQGSQGMFKNLSPIFVLIMFFSRFCRNV